LGYLANSNAKYDVGFLLSDPDFLVGRRNFAPILLGYRDPHFGLFVFVLGFGGISLLPVQNLTSYDTQLLTGLHAESNSVPVCFVFYMLS